MKTKTFCKFFYENRIQWVSKKLITNVEWISKRCRYEIHILNYISHLIFVKCYKL